MWLWRGETGLWERDPATPLNFRGNLLGIAFDPEDPALGYAVGTSEVGLGGVLLRYGKTWTQETNLPPQVQGAAFTSIAFAGSEAIVAWRRQPSPEVQSFEGGLIVNDGSGWKLDEQASAVMGSGVPRTAAGLPDGGAAVLTEGEVDQLYERESAGAPWQRTPIPPPGDGSSLSLFRENGALRAIVAGGGTGNVNLQPPSPPGVPPAYYGPIGAENPGPETAVVLRQTPQGWSDESHELDPIKQPEGGYRAEWDIPYMPDPIAAVLVDPTGSQGWAVGGFINERERLETADIERYPAEGSKPTGVGEEAKVALGTEDVALAIGGHAECSNPCAARARAGVGPQVWLRSAVALAHKIGVGAFVYTGPSISEAAIEGPERTVPIPFSQEFGRTAEILGSAGSSGVYAVASPQDRDARPEGTGSEQLFDQAFAGFPQSAQSAGDPVQQGCTAEAVGCQTSYYAFDQHAQAGGNVRVIVLDDSSDVGAAQLGWLERELASAQKEGMPAIAVGSSDLNAQIAAGDAQAASVAAVLVGGAGSCRAVGDPCAASAYFYDSPEENVKKPLRVGGESIEVFGSGTLGYVHVFNEEKSDFHGASGILLAQVEFGKGKYDPEVNDNRAPVSARLIPVIGELALEGRQGTLLRRSQVALFDGLARRPRAGGVGINNSDESLMDPYVPIPEECVGRGCAVGLFPEYAFRSSNPDIGQFVERNTESADPLAVLQNSKGEPIADEVAGERDGAPVNEHGDEIPRVQSSVFCAYNAGTTTITIEAGGLSASLPVTIQAGSVREPCGTVPLKNLPAAKTQASAPVPPAPAPTPAAAQPAPASTPPPVPLPPPPAIPPPPSRPLVATPPPFVPLAVVSTPLLAFVPPPVPTPARPSPPTGTSAVTSPIEVAEREDEEESATEQASNLAVAYNPGEDEPASVYLLGVLLLAALAGASIRRPRRGRRDIRVAPASLTSVRTRRRMASRQRRRRW